MVIAKENQFKLTVLCSIRQKLVSYCMVCK